MASRKAEKPAIRKFTDRETRLLVRRVTEWLESAGFTGAKAEAYRLSQHDGIRLRIIHEAFHNRSLEERSDMVRDMMDSVPEDIDEIVFYILTVSPKEVRRDPSSLEFDNPPPSYL